MLIGRLLRSSLEEKRKQVLPIRRMLRRESISLKILNEWGSMAVFPGPLIFQWRIQGRGSAGRRPAPPSLRKHPFLLALRRCGRFAAKSEEKRMFSQASPPFLLLDQNEARRAEKIFLETPPPPLISGCGWPPLLPPPPLIWRPGSATVFRSWTSRAQCYWPLLSIFIRTLRWQISRIMLLKVPTP